MLLPCGFASSSHPLQLQASAECHSLGECQGRRAASGMGGDAASIIAPGHRELRPQQPHLLGTFHSNSWENSLTEDPVSRGEALARMGSKMSGQTRSVLGPVAIEDEAEPSCCPTLPSLQPTLVAHSPPWWRPALSRGLVFHTVDTCGWQGQPWAQTRVPLPGAHTLAAGPKVVVPRPALVAAGWEAQSRLGGFSITHVGSALGCLIPGLWVSSVCGEQRGAGDFMGSVCTSPNAAQDGTRVPAPAQDLCCREHDSWVALDCPK